MSDAITEPGNDSDLLRAALGMRPARSAVLAAGTVLGDAYRVVGEIGAGGMGRVYRALDLKLGRDVAIKVHATDGDERLLREASALARLAHPNVVTVFGVGMWGTHPWVAMEYVPGGTARSWLVAAPRRPRDVIALYRDAARGLAAAHVAGLVHRDFKPDNVLVGRDGRARVADFGLARDHADAVETPVDTPLGALTATGAVAGTPAYMAPEQHAGGPVGPAADQFAFATSLWEALAGERPFAATTVGEHAAAVAIGAVATPPKGRIPRRIEAVLRRALEVEPEARWPSLDALIVELADRSATRRRIALLAAAAALAGGTGWLVATRAGAAAETCEARDPWPAAARSALRARLGAHGDADRVMAIFAAWAERWSTAYARACREPSPASLACLDRIARDRDASVDVIEGLAELDRAPEIGFALPRPEACGEPGHAPPPVDDAQRDAIGRVTQLVARSTALVIAGDGKGALASARDAAAGAATLHVPGIEAEAHLAVAVALFSAGTPAGMLDEVERAARLAAEAHDDELAARAWLSALETVATRLEKPGEADRLIAVAESAVVRAGNPPLLRARLAESLAAIAIDRGNYKDAVTRYDDAIRLRELATPDDPDLARTLNKLANVLAEVGDVPRARQLIARAQAIVERSYGPRHRNLGVVLTTRAAIDMAAGDHGSARDALERALAIKEASVGTSHVALAPTLVNLGICLLELGQPDAARTHLERALVLSERALGPDHPKVGLVLSTLGAVAIARADWPEAKRVLDRAVAIEAAHGEVQPLDYTLAKRARVRVALHDLAGGRADLARAGAIAEAVGSGSYEAGVVADALGSLELAAGHPAEARAAFERAIAIFAATVGPDHPDSRGARERLASVPK